MKRMTRVSFSADGKSVNVKLPKSWPELTQKELIAYYKIVCLHSGLKSAPDPRVAMFTVCSGVRVESVDEKQNSIVLRFSKGLKTVRLRMSVFELSELLSPLDFVFSPGTEPVMLSSICGCKTDVDARLHGVDFETYLTLENRYQGFISSENNDALLPIVALIYPKFNPEKHNLKPFEAYGLLQWLVQVKSMFSNQFPNFFRPSSGETSASMLESMNNQIRALTGGDVIKETDVFASDCWRALTELDYKAKEAEEFKRQLSKSKSK